MKYLASVFLAAVLLVPAVSFADSTPDPMLVQGGNLIFCSGPLAPGYTVGLVGGGCGATTTYVSFNAPLADGTQCQFWSGCEEK